MATGIDDLQLENFEEGDNTPPESRIKDAHAGRSIYLKLHESNRPRAFHMARHQALLDGEPPYDQAQLKAIGQGSRTNVDTGDAFAASESVMSGHVDMDNSVERLLRAPIFKQAVPDDEERMNYETILADEITKTIRDWPEYSCKRLTLAHYTVDHGVGIGYFDDHIDWRPEVTWLSDMLIPDGTPASESKITVAAMLRYMEAHTLYEKIRNEESAEALGWNVAMVKRAISKASPDQNLHDNWAKVQESIKNNDLGWGVGGKTSKIGLIHLWVQEFDGTVSKYVTTLDQCDEYRNNGSNGDGEPWVFQKKGAFQEMRQGMVFFSHGIGNGSYHSITGLARRIYPQAVALNRSYCNMLDAANFATSLVLQPMSENFLNRMKIIPMGVVSIAPAKEHAEIIEMNRPNVAQSAMPVVADLRKTMGERSGQFKGGSPFDQNVEKTRFQVAAELEALGKVGATEVNLWYPSWDRLLREMVRRMLNPNYVASPGAREVAEMKKRLAIRGFPLELLEYVDIDNVRAERAIGAGSGAARTATLTQLRELSGEYDEIGRYNLNRDLTAAALNGNYDLATRYIPPAPASRIPLDQQIADLENSLIKMGQEPKLQPGQMPLAHLDSHVPFLLEMVQAIEAGEAQMSELVEPMVMLHEHATQHLEVAQNSQGAEQKVAQYRQLLQQMGEIVQNAYRQYIAEQQKAMEDAGDAGQQGGEMSPQLQEKMIESQIKLEQMQTQAAARAQYDEQKHQQKLRHNEEKFIQEKSFNDAATANDMVAESRKSLQKSRIKLAETAQNLRIKEAQTKAAEANAKKKKPAR